MSPFNAPSLLVCLPLTLETKNKAKFKTMDERKSFGKEFQIFNPTTRIFLLKKKNFCSKIKSNKKTCTLGVGALIKFHILFSCSPRFVPYYDPSSFVVDHIP